LIERSKDLLNIQLHEKANSGTSNNGDQVTKFEEGTQEFLAEQALQEDLKRKQKDLDYKPPVLHKNKIIPLPRTKTTMGALSCLPFKN
jgi:hypothetical protein